MKASRATECITCPLQYSIIIQYTVIILYCILRLTVLEERVVSSEIMIRLTAALTTGIEKTIARPIS